MAGLQAEKIDWLRAIGVTAIGMSGAPAAAGEGHANGAADDGEPAGGSPHAKAPAGKNGTHVLSEHEQLNELLKTQVIQGAVQALLQTYNMFSAEVEKWAGMKGADIDALEAHQTPKRGGIVLGVSKALNAVVVVAFPELVFAEIVGKALEGADKVVEIVEDHDKDADAESEKEVKAAKAVAKKELVELVSNVKKAEQGAESRLADKVEKAVSGGKPGIIKQLHELGTGESQYSKIRAVLASEFDIKRGTDADPGVFKKMVSDLDKQFKDWLKSNYQERHLSKLLTDEVGGDTQIKRVLAKLYLIYTSDDPDKMAKIQKGIDDAEKWYAKQYGIGGPGTKWGFQKVLDKVIKEEDKGYEDLFKGSELHADKGA